MTSTDLAYVMNSKARGRDLKRAAKKSFSPSMARQVRSFHATMPVYQPTPLVALNHLSRFLGVEQIWVKDESYRFGLNAFRFQGPGGLLCTHVGIGTKDRL
jgi:diaminopropionate ammonia-lyase